MSDSSRVQLYYVEESVFGTTPASALTEMRFTGEGLGLDLNTVQSNEIRDDRQVTDVTTVGQEAVGDVNWELSYGTYDTFFESALYGQWGTALTVTDTDISAANSDSSFNSAGSGFPAFVVGQWIQVSGFATAANNGFFRVVSRTASKIVVNGTLTDEAATPSVTIDGQMLRNGVTRTSFTLEKHFADITQFQSFTGMIVGNMSLSVEANAILTGVFNFMGLASALTQATVGTGAANAANTNAVMNASSNVGDLYEGGSLVSGVYFQSLTAALNNKLRPQNAIGSLPHIGIGAGTIELTGTLNAYFATNALMDKYLGSTTSSFSFRVSDAAGNAYIITFPKIKFTNGQVLAGGIDQDVMAAMEWQAVRDPTTDCMIQIDRFAAA